jgi:Predicted oxidoreductases (related to aryl-alcohol dehydrogenases)
MQKIRLGRTNLMVSRSGFGAIPIQRIRFGDADRLLQNAYDGGINFFDTARAYTDSEEKIGHALSSVRPNIIIATKTPGEDHQSVLKDLETSLRNLKTEYIDIYQLHNPKELPDPNDKNSSYSALLEAKKKGMIRWLGLTNHRLELATAAVQSGLYDTVQFPLSSLSADSDLQLIDICKQNDIGLIAMKALAGGLITNAASTFAFLRQYDNVVPIWGIETEPQLKEFLAMEKKPPLLDGSMKEIIDRDRADLRGSFCRACGYCMPCPAGIPIPTAARMSLLLRRMPYQQFMTDDWKKQMLLINECKNCGQCKKHCPYQLDTPKILQEMLRDYQQFYANLHAGA